MSGEGDDHGLPHWSEPGTGEVPRTEPADEEDLAAWSSLTNSGPRWADDPDVAPQAPRAPEPSPPTVPIGGGKVEDDFFSYDTDPRAARRARQPVQEPQPTPGPADSGSPDLIQRVLTAAVLAGVAILCLAIGKAVTLVLVAVVLGVAASEFFVSLRRVGYQPATLLGLTATVALPLGVYWRGESAIGVVMFLTILFGALWYLLGVASERPVPNLGVTTLVIVYVGVLGSFAALLLDTDDGTSLLLVAILLSIAYDVGGFFVGRTMGRSPLTPASPNKTVEGLLGGMLVTVAVGLVIVGIVGISPFDDDPFGTIDAVLVAIAAAIVAPIGDLAESLIKRDLGIKDMGTILPGHGGLLDRFDAMLFVLPTTYYMVRLLA